LKTEILPEVLSGSNGGGSAIRQVPRTGVIYVTTEAAARGFEAGSPEWSNLGQGQPETGALPGAPERRSAVSIDPTDHEYAPVAGLSELREAVAALYNALFRRGMPSQYTAENVAISSGGRSALTRAAAVLGNVNLGHFLPDYTAYEELLDVFRLFSPIPILLDRDRAYAFSAENLEREILGRGLGALLMSNPCNPTGKLISGNELASWVETARRLDCTLLLDEFYSHYVWSPGEGEPGPIATAARVEDVDRDPVVIFDGLTKNWRYPGWRCTWIVGPRAVIDAVSSTGSFLDGGGSKPLQRSAIPLLSPEVARAETAAIRAAFLRKKQVMQEGLARAGIRLDLDPQGTFYCWANLSQLPPSLSDGRSFFKAALKEKVICVPGEFFDINPGKRRSGRPSRFRQYVRFSFGPEERAVVEGVGRIQMMVGRG